MSPTNDVEVRGLLQVDENFGELNTRALSLVKFKILNTLDRTVTLDKARAIPAKSVRGYELVSMELRILQDAYTNKTTRDLIWLDHNCSGFMVLALLFKDRGAAEKLNLISPNEIYDFYTEVGLVGDEICRRRLTEGEGKNIDRYELGVRR